MATTSKQFGNMAGNPMRNVGKPKQATDAMTFAVPNYTTAERDALTATNGIIIFNTTTNKLQAYEGSWKNII